MSEAFNPPERVGFVGLGQMGAPMARNLAKAGFRLALLDARAGVAAGLGLDAELPADAAGVGAACRVLITMLPDGAIVREIILGGHGIASTLPPGSVVIDMSSSSPVGTQSLGAELAKRDIALIDAPVSGGVKRAVDGSLAIMAGGDAAVIERCRPILAAMGKQIFETGPLGSGHAMKALNNYVSAAGLAAAAEAVLAGSRFGLDPQTIVGILNASTGRNNSTELKFPQFILPRKFASGFSLGLMVKDLRTALDVAEATGTPAPIAESVVDTWSEAEKLLGGQADHTAVVQYWEALLKAKSH
jgi:3-hydroxyisobutyrate dehydrogenase